MKARKKTAYAVSFLLMPTLAAVALRNAGNGPFIYLAPFWALGLLALLGCAVFMFALGINYILELIDSIE